MGLEKEAQSMLIILASFLLAVAMLVIWFSPIVDNSPQSKISTAPFVSANVSDGIYSSNHNIAALENGSLKYKFPLNHTLVQNQYFIEQKSIETNKFFHFYDIDNNPTWSIRYNYSSHILTTYAVFHTFLSESEVESVTFSSDISGSSQVVSSTPVFTEGPVAWQNARSNSVPISSTNWGGYEFYSPSIDQYKNINAVWASVNVPNIQLPPSTNDGVPQGLSTWVGLTNVAGGSNYLSNGIAQTGYSRVITHTWFFIWWNTYGNYQLWYETYPNPSYVYPGSPSLSQGWEIDLEVTNNGPGFTYSAEIENTAQFFAVTDNSGVFSTYYAQFMTEAFEFNGQIVQIAEFSPAVQFSNTGIELPGDRTLSPIFSYTNGAYNEYILSQSSGDTNIQDSYSTNSLYAPVMTWLNSNYGLG